MSKILELELALQGGMTAVVKGDRIIITIDVEKTKRDLWTSQIEMWLSKKTDGKNIASGYLRVIGNKLKFISWKK